MRAKGSYKPDTLEYEVVDNGQTAVIRLYENVRAYQEPEDGGKHAASGWEFDRYTLMRPHSDRLREKVETDTAIWLECAREEETAETRRVRLAEAGMACTAAIYAGVEVGGSRYSLTAHDQTEIMAQLAAVKEGAEAVPYHADGELCRMYPAAEFAAVAQAAMAHIFWHRTYCNHLNAWMRRASLAELEGIRYGAGLPQDLTESMAALLEGAAPLIKFLRLATLWMWGGSLYCMIELLWRGRTHPAMYAVGGLCFVVIGGINNWIPWGMPLPLQGVTGALAVTVAELASGMILNVWLGLAIWDYSAMPLNLLGQICLPFSAAWAALSLVAIWLDDLLRHYLFGEDKPRYTFGD